MKYYSTVKLAKQIRLDILKMIHSAKASHIGSCFSVADILAVLYSKIMNINPKRPHWKNRDRFILSKGHAAAAIYSVLGRTGFFPIEYLKNYCQNGAKLSGHISNNIPGVEVSTGSLGHGLPIGCGMALAAKKDAPTSRVFVLLSDGDCEEGSTWEAALFSSHHTLDNLIAIVDYNKIQAFGRVKDVLDLEPLDDKWSSFGWSVRQVDGHNHDQLKDTLFSVPFTQGKPSVIIAHTIKGKGVSFMENNILWHYKSPNDKELKEAITEISAEE